MLALRMAAHHTPTALTEWRGRAVSRLRSGREAGNVVLELDETCGLIRRAGSKLAESGWTGSRHPVHHPFNSPHASLRARAKLARVRFNPDPYAHS